MSVTEFGRDNAMSHLALPQERSKTFKIDMREILHLSETSLDSIRSFQKHEAFIALSLRFLVVACLAK